MTGRAAETGVTLTLDVSEDVGQALIDPEAVHQCLLNLLANAVGSASRTTRPRTAGRP